MKRLLSTMLLVLLVVSQAACSQPASPAETTASAHEETQDAPSSPVETLPFSPSPAPEPKMHVPMDIFGSEFNPYADMKLPDIFNVFAASFSKGSAKLEGKNPYTLYLTGSGDMSEAIAYHAGVAGLTEDEKNACINGFLEVGFCEFVGVDGRVVTIRQTNLSDNRYEYVEGGCLIEIAFDVGAADLEKYTNLVRDNYNLNALAPVAEYFGIEPDFSECDISVNLHKKEVSTAVVYYASDVEALQHRIAENAQSAWFEWNGLPATNISYGLIESNLIFDSRGGAVTVLQTSNEFSIALGKYFEPEFSLTKFGFGFGQDGACGVYEQHEPHYMSVAIHRPEWGQFDGDWNIEFMDEVNGYNLRITYHAVEDRYHISLDKGSTRAAFDYLSVSKEYTGEYPDRETVKQLFNDAFGTQNDEFYEKPLAYFEQLVQERFGMSIEGLYDLPII